MGIILSNGVSRMRQAPLAFYSGVSARSQEPAARRQGNLPIEHTIQKRIPTRPITFGNGLGQTYKTGDKMKNKPNTTFPAGENDWPQQSAMHLKLHRIMKVSTRRNSDLL
jgi:hypothetical protein